MTGDEAAAWVRCGLWLVALAVAVFLAWKFMKGVSGLSWSRLKEDLVPRKSWR